MRANEALMWRNCSVSRRPRDHSWQRSALLPMQPQALIVGMPRPGQPEPTKNVVQETLMTELWL